MNVILPCAGKGTRLALPYPKEMHHVAHGLSLIDLSLHLLLPYRHLIDRVTITLTAEKAELVRFLGKWRSHFPFAFTYFDEQFEEWPGSILSAGPLFLEQNVVLLPDSLIKEDGQYPIVPTFGRLLREHDLVFGVKRESSARLQSLGALRIEDDGRVSAFCDKPSANLDHFNGFWGCFGFSMAAARGVLDLMTSSVQRQSINFETLGIRGPVGFPLQDYHDLGVWSQLTGISHATEARP